MAAASLGYRTGDEFEGIAGAGVFRDLVARIIGRARARIENEIFKNGAEANGIPDTRLAGRRQANRLGVAAAFEVEDPLVRPAVFVIADQSAFGIGRQRGFAGAR